VSAFRRRIRRAIVATRGVPLVRGAVRALFRAGAARAAARLAATPGVRSVYVRHGHPSSPTFVPGLSDLDLTLVLDEAAAEDPDAIARVAAALEHVARAHPYAHPADARLTSARELARLTRSYEAPFTLLVTPDDWRLVAGEESRSEHARPFPARRVARHPEFARWWREVLPRHALRRPPRGEPASLRPFFRGAVKQRLHFLAARGRALPGRRGYVEEQVAEPAFAGDPATAALLRELRRGAYARRRGADAVVAALFHRTLADAEAFYRDHGVADADHDAPFTGDGSAHGPRGESSAAAAAIAARLAECPRLAERVEGAIVYPLPCVDPAFHQADLVLPDGADAERVRAILDALLAGLDGRESSAQGHPFAVSLVPRAAAESILAWEASPFPFLPEHVAVHGRAVLGATMPRALARGRHDAEILEWLRDFLPCHLFTLKRRAAHASRTVNALQLAAVRRYLETGDLVTEPGAYRDVAEDERRPVAERQVRLFEEYDRVEALLATGGVHAVGA